MTKAALIKNAIKGTILGRLMHSLAMGVVFLIRQRDKLTIEKTMSMIKEVRLASSES